MKISPQNVLNVSLLLISIHTISPWSSLAFRNTFFWWGINLIVLIAVFKVSAQKNVKGRNEGVIKCYLVWVACSFLYGITMAEFYWDWKLLINNLMVFSLPLFIYAMSNRNLLAKFLSSWLKYLLILFPIIVLTSGSDAYGRYLTPISILLVFFYFLTTKWKFICLVCVVFIVLSSFGSRSNGIKILVPFVIGMIYYLARLVSLRKLRRYVFLVSFIMLVLPFAMFFLGVTGKFNIFNFNDYISIEESIVTKTGKNGSEFSLLDDTRTLLYKEEIESAIRNNYAIFGRSLARGYDTNIFASAYMEYQLDTNRQERQSSEVSILNIFNHLGIVGVALYFLIFLTAVRNAVGRSKSKIMALIGIYVAFRWSFAWIEDFNRFDLDYIGVWLFVAMCYSNHFLTMTDKDFSNWLKFSVLLIKSHLNVYDVRPKTEHTFN